MKLLLALALLATLAACGQREVKFSAPPSDAPSWDLNVGRWPGTNDLIHPPGTA